MIHEHIEKRKKEGPHLTKHEHIGFNGWLAVKITGLVATMWCAYAFAVLALISLPSAIHAGTAALIAWIAQTFLQLVLLSVIMVGQKVAAAASDKQAEQTYRDIEILLKVQEELQALTKEIHQTLSCNGISEIDGRCGKCEKFHPTIVRN